MATYRSPALRLDIVATCVAAGLAMSSFCEAGGFFRRVPEVGEWARYEMTCEFTADIERLDREVYICTTGSLLLKCIGTVEIDQVPHVWLEARFETETEGGETNWVVLKLLVPSEHVIETDLTEHISRGWMQSNGEEAHELPPIRRLMRLPRHAPGTMMMVFEDSRVLEVTTQERRIIIDGQEMSLTHCESGVLPTHSGERVTVSKFWPSEELAFGVAAVENMVSGRTQSGSQHETITQFELVEEGTDAVSELPDHN